MESEKTQEECDGLAVELEAAEQAREHFQLALELDQKMQAEPS